ncbi:MAG TPA: sensor histidine kinase [Candidatus Dormibacteraeota bacterium]|nr:sensor histidine kinase [Candidatus Dormibacteraeota bacterium]
MQPHAAERRHLERQIAYARPIFMVLALVDLLERPPLQRGPYAVLFVAVYLCVALFLVLMQNRQWIGELTLPLPLDIAALAVFLVLSRSVVSFWFVYLFVALAAGMRWGTRKSVILAGVVTFALLVRTALNGPLVWEQMLSWVALSIGTFAAGAGMSFLGSRQRNHAAEQEFLARLTGLLEVDRGMAESLRLVLTQLVSAFDCEEAVLAFRDLDLERIFVWRFRAGDDSRLTPENLPATRSDGFLLDHPDASLCWNQLDAPSDGFGWNRKSGRRLKELPRLPGPMRQELGWRSALGVTLDLGGLPVGRLMLGNARRRFVHRDLQWLERIVRHLGQPLQNLFLLRHIRAHAIEGERSRISREIHDGILQTLLSVDIQLDVLRRKVPTDPQQAVGALSSLQQTVRNETDELRRMVTDMRPLRVQSADLVDLMRGFAERFRNEAGLGIDLIIDAAELQIPDRICRDLFQIYRESLHNVKKHAHASHVVVKLWQNESQVALVVDDNGDGFSFAGRFNGDELDRLRLGPISIKERTRSVGGVLTVESTPGHGARLTVEVPLG